VYHIHWSVDPFYVHIKEIVMDYLEYLGLILGFVLAGSAIAFPFFLNWLAEENILFTKVQEGTVKTILRGRSFERHIMSFENYHLNDPSHRFDPSKPEWEVIYHGVEAGTVEERNARYDDRHPLLKHFGLYWVGLPWANSVYVYSFEWNETYTDKDGKEKVLPRAEPTDFIYVTDFTYAIVTEGAETRDMLLTQELTLVTVAIRNPYRALFSGEDWMRRITAAINRNVRAFVGTKPYTQLISAVNPVEFSRPIIKLNEKLPDDGGKVDLKGLKRRYGVEIRTADLQTIELSGDAQKQNQEATTKAYVAGREAEATVIASQAKATSIQNIGEAEAGALEKRLAVIKSYGDAGVKLAGFDAIREASNGPGSTVVWANDPLGATAGILNAGKKGNTP
jgi:hypothetical protein